MRLLLDGGEHLRECAQLIGRESAGDRSFERIEVTVDARGDLTAAGGQLNDEGPTIGGAHLARDEPALGEPIENAGERRSFVRQASVQAGDGRRSRRREVREDVRLALRHAELSDVQADPVRRSMNRRNQAQGHRR